MTSTLSHISLICIPMTDQDAALAFYTDHLGMELRVNEPFADGAMRWIEVAPPGAQTTIALAPPPQGVPTGGMQTGIILTTSDVDAEHARLRDAGVDVDAEVSRMGDPVPPMFWLRDPENNVLMIAENDRA